jgi:hypothetical protein
LKADSLDFGFMYEPHTMMGMYRVGSIDHGDLILRANMLHREIVISFRMKPRTASLKRVNSPENPQREYNIIISLLQPLVIRHVGNENLATFVLNIETPPKVFQEIDSETTHQSGNDRWSRRNAMRRQTDILLDTKDLQKDPIALKKTKATIDFGEC